MYILNNIYMYIQIYVYMYPSGLLILLSLYYPLIARFIYMYINLSSINVYYICIYNFNLTLTLSRILIAGLESIFILTLSAI